MINLFKPLIVIVLLFTSSMSQASFEHVGKLVVGFESGQIKEQNFVLAFREKGDKNEFQIGKQKFVVAGKPDSYSLAMVLGENNLVWLNEFSGGYFKTFKLEIGSFTLKLAKKVYKDPVMGDYVLSINNVDYFFQSQVAQLTFKFGEKGIEEIEADGMVASIGLNTADPDDCNVYTEGSAAKAECEFLNN